MKSFFPSGRTDRQTNTTKVVVGFRNFANAPKHHSVDNVEENKKTLRSDIHPKHTTARSQQDVEFLGAFGKLRKATNGFVMSACLSVRRYRRTRFALDRFP